MDKRIVEETASRLAGKKELRILFVCLGNICRSPAAEGVMAEIVSSHDDPRVWVLDSAGTGSYHIGELPDRRMRVHARNRDIELTHHCRQLRGSDFYDFDLLIGMDSSNLANMRRVAPDLESARKIAPMAAWLSDDIRYDHIPDPYYEGSEGFELVLDLLDNACNNLYNSLSTSLS